ncbi:MULTISPECIES: alpha/beta hydrolase fold domain-containing protein [Streptacidiphilus]|uniref:Alpha/beta hydrolase fold domain-containing protein n=1 Tax=Streptacidiphilus cavernicola TaxID=3342716 RepID=A0ABV6UMP2_9ACTN|nr:alpha/beta hydrolase fold domain-containing protein [Streptacidiphilus jeojiense]
MSVLARPAVAALAAKGFQRLVRLSERRSSPVRFPEFPGNTRELTIPTSIGPARAVVYSPADGDELPPVHVNFHGGGYVLPLTQLDDPLCRCLAAQAGVVVVNVDYVLAPQHRFPAPPRQAFEVVRWVAEHGAEHGWDGARLSIGGQSAGGGLAAAVARQALEQGGPAIALQVLHYPPLDLATGFRDKGTPIKGSELRPWMAEIFNNSYIPNPQHRTDRLASPAHPTDTTDLTGIAPGLVITAELDLLRPEAEHYAERLRTAGALIELHNVAGADHGYDVRNDERAREIYTLIATQLRRTATRGGAVGG